MPAPSRVGDITIDRDTTSEDLHTTTHTTTADTDLLLIIVSIEGAETIENATTWDGVEPGVIEIQTEALSNNECEFYIYGVVSPGAKTADFVTDFLANVNPYFVALINYTDVDTTDLATAVNLIDDVVNLTNQDPEDVTLSSGGSSGNTLVACGSINRGLADDSSSMSDSFVKYIDRDTNEPSQPTAGGPSDIQTVVGELLTGLPSGVTITFGTGPDETSGVLIELVAAAAAGEDEELHADRRSINNPLPSSGYYYGKAAKEELRA